MAKSIPFAKTAKIADKGEIRMAILLHKIRDQQLKNVSVAGHGRDCSGKPGEERQRRSVPDLQRKARN
jgi:hypothetical protein